MILNVIYQVLLFFIFGWSHLLIADKQAPALNNDRLSQLLTLKKQQRVTTVFEFPLKMKLQRDIESLERKLGINNVVVSNKPVMFFLESIPLFFWQILLLFFWAMFFGMIFYPRVKAGFKSLIFMGICLLMSAKMLQRMSKVHLPLFCVVTDQAPLYSGPHDSYPVIANLPMGFSAFNIGTQDNFIKIQSDVFCGWIAQNTGDFIN